MMMEHGVVVSHAIEGKADPEEKFKMYASYSEPVSKIPSHRMLAIRRGANEEFLSFEIELDQNKAFEYLKARVLKSQGDWTPHLEQAVDFLRRAGTLHHLPRAMLARGTDVDLAEVQRIASRSGMKLFLADYHLAMARGEGSIEHLEKAARLVAETGYHRRDGELSELRALLGV